MAARNLPESFLKLVISRLSTNFRDAVEPITVPLLQPGPDELLVKTRYVGINATDINHSAGRYHRGEKPPLDAGLENMQPLFHRHYCTNRLKVKFTRSGFTLGVKGFNPVTATLTRLFKGIGEVVSTGDRCTNFHLGQAVGYIKFGAFSEYVTVPSQHVLPLPKVDPHYVPLLISGLTAALALEKVGEIKRGETVLVTAAAGGTGQLAVQLAKLAGCNVVGTCSTHAKQEFLKSLGCDRPVNYKTEILNTVLKQEFPRGVDVVYESVGGEIFDSCVNNLARKGRLVIIGFITGYQSKHGFTPVKTSTLVPKLLWKSASVRGFLMFDFADEFKTTFANLVELYDSGRLKCNVDFGNGSQNGPFKGLDSITEAVEYLHSGQSAGKVVVEIPDINKSHL